MKVGDLMGKKQNANKQNKTPHFKETIYVKVNNMTYEIIEESDGNNVYAESENDPDGASLGLCDNLTEQIYIYKNMSLTNKRRVLAHELAHAFAYSSFCRKDEYTEEEMCNFVESFALNIVKIVDEVYPVNN